MRVGPKKPGLTVKVWHKRIRGSEKYYQVRGLHFGTTDGGKQIQLLGYTDSGQDVAVDIDAKELMNAFDQWRRAQAEKP